MSDEVETQAPSRRRFPPWLVKRLPAGGSGARVREVLQRLGVNTVCRHALCPNQGECFSRGTATFMILGAVCTRNCRFCAVASGVPAPPEADEPARVAQAAAELALDYVVVTSVTRDDLADGGAAHFAATIRALRGTAAAGLSTSEVSPDFGSLVTPPAPSCQTSEVQGRLQKSCGPRVEVLTPDFGGSAAPIETVVAARPDVYNHNVETVPRLYAQVRPQADYRRSLDLLARVKAADPALVTKSGLMVGLGERPDEVTAVMRDLRAAGCQVLTIGQYLRPSEAHLAVERFVPPAEFEAWRAEALALGFEAVASAPFVRSSYEARAVLESMESPRTAVRGR